MRRPQKMGLTSTFRAREGTRTPDRRVTRPSRVVPGRPIVSRHVPQNSSATTGFGRLLEHGGTEWETVRHSCWHGCWHDNPSRNVGRPLDATLRRVSMCPLCRSRRIASTLRRRHMAPGYGPPWLGRARRSGNFSTPSRQRSRIGVRGLPRQRSTSRVRGQVHWHSQTQNARSGAYPSGRASWRTPHRSGNLRAVARR